MSELRLCVGCHWHVEPKSEKLRGRGIHVCVQPRQFRTPGLVSPVTGDLVHGVMTCREAREPDGICGPFGNLWEAADDGG